MALVAFERVLRVIKIHSLETFLTFRHSLPQFVHKYFLILLFSFGLPGWAKSSLQEEIFVFGGAEDIDASSNHIDAPLGEEISKDPDFLYFESQAPSLPQSLIYKGVSQRQLSLTYNGFRLIDPSTPEGVFNFFSISHAQHMNLVQDKQSLDFRTSFREGELVSGRLSSLGTVSSYIAKGECVGAGCFEFKLGLNQLGGISQFAGGEEKDFSRGVTLEASHFGHERSASHLMISAKRSDDDDLFGGRDDENAFSDNVFLFLAHEWMGENFGFRGSGSVSYRSQENPADEGSSASTSSSFSQEGQGFEGQFHFKPFQLNFIHERFEAGDSRANDNSAELLSEIQRGKYYFSGQIGYSDSRDVYWKLEAESRGFQLYYRKLLPSLFQFNDEFAGNPNLQSETFLGGSFRRKISINKYLKSVIEVNYQRGGEVIAFSDPDGFAGPIRGSYKNINEVDVFFSKISTDILISKLSLSPFVIYTRARDLTRNSDLPRRPRFRVGTQGKLSFGKTKLFTRLNWTSERIEFDGVAQGSFLESEVKVEFPISRGKMGVWISNLLDQRREVIPSFTRPGIRAGLEISKYF